MSHLSDVLRDLNTREYSSRKIAELAEREGHDVHYTTISRYLGGKHPIPPRYEVLAAFASALRVPIEQLTTAGNVAPRTERFELPDEADALDEQERQAVVNLVKVMAARKRPQAEVGTLARAYEDATSNVTSLPSRLHPETDSLDAAAYENADTEWKRRREADRARGEESQEPPTDDA